MKNKLQKLLLKYNWKNFKDIDKFFNKELWKK